MLTLILTDEKYAAVQACLRVYVENAEEDLYADGIDDTHLPAAKELLAEIE